MENTAQVTLEKNIFINDFRINKDHKVFRKSIVVVGDKFFNFTNQYNIFTYTQIKNLLHDFSWTTDNEFSSLEIILGQGLSDEQILALQEMINNDTHLKQNILLKNDYFAKRSTKKLTHKHLNQNILISEPHRIRKERYTAFLVINDNCAEMSDHVTGKHLQGMVIIEAARQFTIAVTEKYFLSYNIDQAIGFVTNKLETKFIHYLFPIKTKMHYVINRIRGIDPKNQTFDVTVIFSQSGQITAEVRYKFSTISQKYLHERESEAAQKAISLMLRKGKNKYAHSA